MFAFRTPEPSAATRAREDAAQDLAQDAMNSKSFHLACEIFERHISQYGPSFRLYLLLGDAYAKGERFQEAIDAYIAAYRLEPMRPEHFRSFINALLDVMRKSPKFLVNRRASISCARKDPLSCLSCHGILFEPVTIPCGHSFCRKCVAKDTTNTCKSCGIRHLHLPSLNVNVSLQSLIEKLFPREIQSVAKKEEGNKQYSKGKFQAAIDLYTEALALSPNDHILFGNRANVYLKLKQFREAEIDADNAIRLRPDWSKGFFRKAQALAAQQKLVEACGSYLQCLLLDESREVKTHLGQVLIQLIDPTSPINQELKAKAGPSTGHSQLVQGLSKLLKDGPGGAAFEESLREDADSSDEESSDWSRTEKYNILPLFAVRDGISRSMPLLRPPSHFCSEVTGFRKRNSFDTDLAGVPHKFRSVDILDKASSTSSLSCSAASSSKGKGRGKKKADRDDPPSECLPCRILYAAAEIDPDQLLARMGKREFDRNKLDEEDFQCSLCLRLLWEPVTTSCGHVFCRSCLDRVTDHSTKCPLCKSGLEEFISQRVAAPTQVFLQLIRDYFSKAHDERRKIHEAELAEVARMGSEVDEIPIFVCTLAFPNITCPLHVFEPRYRLMVRQAMETGSRQFGMCMHIASEQGGFASHGTMLEIQDVSYFPDGRSVVNTMGGRRFRVVSRGMRDGYNTAKVEIIHDVPETEADAIQSLAVLENRVYDIARHWFTSLPRSKQERIASHFGAFPTRVPGEINSLHGPTWTWWEIAVLPIDQFIQLRLLAGTSLRERLLTLQLMLLHINHTMGIGPLPPQDPRNDELTQTLINSFQGRGNNGVLEFQGGRLNLRRQEGSQAPPSSSSQPAPPHQPSPPEDPANPAP